MGKKQRYKYWDDYPPIKECADMGDVNGNKLDMGIVELEDRVIELAEEK